MLNVKRNLTLLWLSLFTGMAQAIVFTVNSTGNASDANPADAVCATSNGSCTLRAAIEQANFVPGPHTINFNIPGPGVHEIDVSGGYLPHIHFAGSIDGTTQPGSSCASASGAAQLKISLRGDMLTGKDPGSEESGLYIDHADVTIKGLVIGNFLSGIRINTLTESSNTNDNISIQCNHIGISPDGEESSLYSLSMGIDFYWRDFIEGCSFQIIPASWTQTPDGLIGGTNIADRNVISATDSAVYVSFWEPYAASTQGFPPCFVNTGARTFVGGHLRVSGNYIGTDASGNPGAIVSENGIHLIGHDVMDKVTIGGDVPEAGNLISNNLTGIYVDDSRDVGIYNNQIGSMPIGISPQGNHGDAVTVWSSRLINIGKNDGTDGNHILGNLGRGIVVDKEPWVTSPPPAVEVSIRGNRIHDNSGLGIDLGDDGVTQNDAGDVDAGINDLQNFPLKVTADSTGTVEGIIDTAGNETIMLDFFSSDQCDVSGFGEGESFLGTTTIVTPATGNASFSYNVGGILPGKYITVTATNSFQNTSEFSLCSRVAEKVFTVDTANLGPDVTPGDGNCLTSAGRCSLRAAIEEANALTGGPYKIHFNGAFTILPVTPLPAISTSVILDATANGVSTCGDAASYGVVLNGASQTSGNGLTLGVGSNGSQVRGLLVAGFPGHGIHVQGSNNQIVCNHIGKTGPLAGSYLGNGLNGVHINGAGNILGGATAELRNVISGNVQSGVKIDLGATANRVMGNAVGLNGALSGAMPNGMHGVELDMAFDNVIGGSSLPERNILSGNTQYGIKLQNGSTGNSIRSNYIGTSVDGVTALPNIKGGVLLDNAPNNTVGGTQPKYGNLVSGNTEHGITTQNGSDSTSIRNNDIGLNKNGEQLPNGFAGVHLLSDTNAVTSNDISFNVGDGVNAGASTLHNKIRQNSMVGNGGLGIDLDNDGVTPNDAGDADSGANNLQNFPVVAYAQPDTGLVGFSLDVASGMDYYVDFYSSATCDVTGHGEGDVFWGSHSFTGTATAPESVVATAMSGFAAEDWITATATLGSGQSSTSEFSACIPAIPNHLKLQNLSITGSNALHRACSYITGEMDSRVIAGTNAILRTGTSMQFRDGFAVELGATLTLQFTKPNACP